MNRVSQRQWLRVTAVGSGGHKPVVHASPEWGSPTVVLGGPSEAITFVLGSAGSFRAYLLSANPFTLATKR